MKKWTSLSSTNEDARWKLLEEAVKSAGVPNEYVPWTGEITTFDDLKMLEGFDHVRMSNRVAPLILKNLKVQSSWITLLGVLDGMVKTPKGWWPLCALHESLSEILIGIGKDLDMRASVLIAGAGSAARTALAAFSKTGFTHFLVTNFSPQEAEETIREVKLRFFGAKIEWVPMESIVLLPGESSVLVNCTPSTEDNALLRELSYMNFLKRPGFVFDLSRAGKVSILAEEARAAGVEFISGDRIAAHTDVLWAKWAFQADIRIEDYLPRLQAASTST